MTNRSKAKDKAKEKVENPEAHFAKPKEVVKDNALSNDEKKSALNTWEQDELQLLTASDEGMPGSDEGLRSDAGNRLGEVLRAEGVLDEALKNTFPASDPVSRAADAACRRPRQGKP